MDLVLGLSMASSSVRWVLVDGATTGESLIVERGATTVDDQFDAAALVDRLLERSVHAVGLTWDIAAEDTVSAVWQAFTDRGVENVIAVSDVEAAEALARGIADIAGCERLVVCVAEPGSSLLATVTPDGVTADHVDSAALTDLGALAPDVVFVLGSGDVSGVMAALEQEIEAPVHSADEAHLALARGAALASASAVSILDAQDTPAARRLTPTATLASVLAAAVVTFVVSLSVAIGMTLTPERPAPQMARAVSEPAAEPAPSTSTPKPAKAAPREPEAVPAPPPPVAEPVAVEMPLAPAPVVPQAPAPVYEEPLAPAPVIPPAPEYVPPAPAYVPPAPVAPAYVPPAQVPVIPQQPVQQPRLRDRIIERIPIINRFHEPKPW
ncbi:DUF7159 family protein [Mycolicibacterium parafortuitum]|uniref:Agglutinin receptor n=1 Tax=Mycolicibacterium parafortuitum TaxID=39692 RepID=A0A375YG34_MYCPF|nr:hypothetical protein [Mycolicibacterium parafortuitum]ORB28832.1 hypothetical protein BST38_17830 [Mycolicibacterium parafortuitum]SRX80062.1 Agglutinin receptor [Mycolicibacterium parafortuitum]